MQDARRTDLLVAISHVVAELELLRSQEVASQARLDRLVERGLTYGIPTAELDSAASVRAAELAASTLA
jgi:hypothetical protein